jgi:hypothetical protein
MDVLPGLFQAVDSLLIAPYRWPGHPVIGWWLGTSILAIWTALLGRLTIALVFRVNRRYIEETVQEMDQRHHQSINALKSGDRSAYKGINKLANEAFGKSFFSLAALSMARLWPAPFALAWMQYRFLDVEFPIPFTGYSVGYIAPFIVLYIVAYQIVKQLKRRLPFFRLKKAILDT